MAGGFSSGSISESKGSGVKDVNERNNLRRAVQTGFGENKKNKSQDYPHSMMNQAAANKNFAPDDIPSQKKKFNAQGSVLSDIPKQVNETLGSALMASVSFALITGGLAGIPAIVGASDFFANAAGSASAAADIPMDLMNEFGLTDIN